MAQTREAQRSDIFAISEFLASRLAGRGGPARYRRYLEYAWLADKPNLGFLIEDAGRVRGFAGAIYTRREIRGGSRTFCNLHSLAVDPEFRALTLPMLQRFLAQRDCTYTCFSPSGPVVEILKFFKFQVLDGAKVLFTPAAGLRRLASGGVRVRRGRQVTDHLDSAQQAIMRDHAAYRCGHFLLEAEGSRCYFVTVRRGHDVRAFADVLYASDPRLLVTYIAHAHVPVGITHRAALIGIDQRFVPGPLAGTLNYARLRPALFRSPALQPHEVDALYSELVPMYG